MADEHIVYVKIDDKCVNSHTFSPPNRAGGLTTNTAKLWKHIEKSATKFGANVISRYVFSDQFNSAIYAMQMSAPPQNPFGYEYSFQQTTSAALKMVASSLDRLADMDGHTPGATPVSSLTITQTGNPEAVALAMEILQRTRNDGSIKTMQLFTVYTSDNEPLVFNLPPSTSVAFKTDTALILSVGVTAANRNNQTATIQTNNRDAEITFSNNEADLFCRALADETGIIIEAYPMIYYLDGQMKIASYRFAKFIKYELSKQYTIPS